ncbi:MAG: PilW family protein [Desulfuromonadales bacterium]|nr:PilW family protein [Desulfuromonadales bacterium]
MKLTTQKGFSLTELLVVVAITGVVSTAIMGFFISQQRSHTGQEQVTFIQQNARAGLGVMSRELRMAGFDPTRSGTMIFQNPGKNTITFHIDLNEDGNLTFVDPSDGATKNDPGEEIVYSYDAAKFELERNGQVMAEGIEAMAFAYAYDSNGDGVLEPGYAIAGSDGLGPLDGTVNWFTVNADASTTDTNIPAIAADIRAVKIWLLARTEADSQDYTNTNTYIVGTQTISPTATNLHRRHLLLETVVRCRNMGL